MYITVSFFVPQEAARLKNDDITIVSVGVGNNVDLTELRNIASHPSLVVRSYDFNGFLSLLPDLQQIVCARKFTTPVILSACVYKLNIKI